MTYLLYLDTNVYLSFYDFTKEDLEELRKVAVLIKDERIKLLLPQQTIDEFYRNRENKIGSALEKFKENRLNNEFPNICKDYEELAGMKSAIKAYDKLKSKLEENLIKDIKNNSLKADQIINALFNSAEIININDNILNKAKRRFDLGNPPGKKGSYGDAVNWQSLIEVANEGDDLYFISDDKDYYSLLDKQSFNPYLKKEWEELLWAKIHYFRSLSVFMKQFFPNIKLADEYHKETLIEKLGFSSSFRMTRTILYELESHNEFTKDQIEDILIASTRNNQIYWLNDDKYVRNVLMRFYNGVDENSYDRELVEKFLELYSDTGQPRKALYEYPEN